VYDNLFFAGHERFGAIGVSSSLGAYTPFPERPLPRLEDVDDLADAVQIIESGEGELGERQRALMGAGASLGGAKPKAAISIDSEEWMLKFFNGEPFDLPLVEHATMTLAHKAGIQVAHTRLVRLKGEHAVAIKRFDRQGGMRIHCISASTLLRSEVPRGVEPEFGYPQLARALRRSANPRTLDSQLHELFRRMIFNILIANTDDHEKNHALLCHINGKTMTLELSPGYDMVTTGSGALEHQFMISDNSRQPSLADAMTVARDFELSPLNAAKEVAALIAVVNSWKAHFQSLGVTDRDLAEIGAFIDAPDLLTQRLSFSPAAYAVKSATPRKLRLGARIFR
jgi:serine/threonine-protein kinase HipA